MPLGSAPLRGITARLGDGSLVDLDLTLRVIRVCAWPASVPLRELRKTNARNRIGSPLPDHVLFGAAAEPHAHLDKALSWNELHPPSVTCVRRSRRGPKVPPISPRNPTNTAPVAQLMMLGNGYGDPHARQRRGPDDPTCGARDQPGPRRTRRADRHPDRLPARIDRRRRCRPRRARRGADLVGVHHHLADDPLTDLHRLLDIAEARGVGTDMHIDEFLQGDHLTINAYADRVASWPADRIRTASHCSRLSTLSPAELADVTGRRVRPCGVVALPITNLYLQGHDGPGRVSARSRDRCAASRVVSRCAGADNLRDRSTRSAGLTRWKRPRS